MAAKKINIRKSKGRRGVVKTEANTSVRAYFCLSDKVKEALVGKNFLDLNVLGPYYKTVAMSSLNCANLTLRDTEKGIYPITTQVYFNKEDGFFSIVMLFKFQAGHEINISNLRYYMPGECAKYGIPYMYVSNYEVEKPCFDVWDTAHVEDGPYGQLESEAQNKQVFEILYKSKLPQVKGIIPLPSLNTVVPASSVIDIATTSIIAPIIENPEPESESDSEDTPPSGSTVAPVAPVAPITSTAGRTNNRSRKTSVVEEGGDNK